jgi:hypothetical protein
MGKKSKAPKPPDYTPLAKASEASSKYSYDLAQRQQDWAEKTYAENKDLTDTIIDSFLGQMDQQQQWATEDRSRYQTIFQPLEEQLAAEAQDYATPERQEKEAGAAEADVASQFATARQTAADRLEAYGVDPSSTRSGSLDLGTRVAEAAAQASAGNQARTQTENIGRALRSEAINVGKGYPGQYQAAISGSGQAGNQAANTALAQTTSGANTMGTGQSWQQLGNNAIAGWGDILNNSYTNKMQQFDANQKASSGWGDLLGWAAGRFLPGMAEGGVIPDAQSFADGGQAIPPEMSPSGGQVTDDVEAQIDGVLPAQLNAGEFVVPEDVTKWMGEKGLQQMILKARKEMTNGNGERPAQPEVGPPPMAPDGAGAIPEPMGAV